MDLACERCRKESNDTIRQIEQFWKTHSHTPYGKLVRVVLLISGRLGAAGLPDRLTITNGQQVERRYHHRNRHHKEHGQVESICSEISASTTKA